jgi:hypothetical protein
MNAVPSLIGVFPSFVNAGLESRVESGRLIDSTQWLIITILRPRRASRRLMGVFLSFKHAGLELRVESRQLIDATR